MKTSVVYVITSSFDDTYLEQMYFSMYSLRMYNPMVNIIIVCDTSTAQSFIVNRKKLMEIANEVIPVEVPTQFNNMQKSRFLKTSLRKYISGDFLYQI